MHQLEESTPDQVIDPAAKAAQLPSKVSNNSVELKYSLKCCSVREGIFAGCRMSTVARCCNLRMFWFSSKALSIILSMSSNAKVLVYCHWTLMIHSSFIFCTPLRPDGAGCVGG